VRSRGAAEAGIVPAPFTSLLSYCEEDEELEWLESLMLEAEDEDSVLAVV
jgi:hypothetical protein